MNSFNKLHTFILFLTVSNALAQNPVELTLMKDSMIVKNASLYIDVNGSQTYKTIHNQLFQQIKKESSLDPSVNVYWLKFSLINSTSKDEQWVLEFPNWGYVEYFTKNEGLEIVQKTGFLVPAKQRGYLKANSNYILAQVSSAEIQECLVKLTRFKDKQYIPTNFEFIVWDKSVVDSANENRKWIIGIIMGVFGVMFFYNLFLYFSTREASYLYYIGAVFCLLYLTLQNSGFAIEFLSFWDNYVLFRDAIDFLAVTSLTIFILQFSRRILQLNTNLPKWDKIFTIMIYVMIGKLVLELVSLYINDIYEIVLLFGYLVSLSFLISLIFVGIKCYRKRVPSSGFFLLGWSFTVLGSVILILSAIGGVIPMNDFTIIYAMPLGSTFEMIFFSFALAFKINVLTKDNKIKQQKIIQHLKENEKLQTKVNRELEEKVAKRTEEIQHQNQQINEQKHSIQLEKDRSERLLLNILPKEIAEELKLSGHATPRYYKNVSILFVDIQGFSMKVEKIAPNDLVKDLDYCFAGFDYITSRNNLEKIKTIGDSYMCVGGLPKENESHALNAVNAAFEMIDFVEKWKDEKPALAENGLNLRLGINTGAVISGVVGNKKFQFDIWGDAVNLASRMETTSQPGKINISNSTYSMVKEHYKCAHRGKIPIKNLGEVDMYFVEEKIRA